MDDEEYAIVFSGGGALGAWEVGCLKAVVAHHKGRLPSIVTGASAGAINAAGVCAGLTAEDLHKLWRNLKKPDVYSPRPLPKGLFKAMMSFSKDKVLAWAKAVAASQTSLLDTTALEATLQKILFPVYYQFEQSPIAFALSATRLDEGVPEIFYKLPPGIPLPPDVVTDRQRLWTNVSSLQFLLQALMGTTALPILFPPMQERFDGGVLMNQPITPAIELGARRLYVFIPSSTGLGRTRNLLEIGETMLSTWLAVSLINQIERVKLRNFIREQTGDPLLEICVIRPPLPLERVPGAGLLSFGEKVNELVENGKVSAEQRLLSFDPRNQATWY